MFIIKITRQLNSAGKDVEKRKTLHTVGGNENCYSHYRKQDGASSSKRKNGIITLFPWVSTGGALWWLVVSGQPSFIAGWDWTLNSAVGRSFNLLPYLVRVVEWAPRLAMVVGWRPKLGRIAD